MRASIKQNLLSESFWIGVLLCVIAGSLVLTLSVTLPLVRMSAQLITLPAETVLLANIHKLDSLHKEVDNRRQRIALSTAEVPSFDLPVMLRQISMRAKKSDISFTTLQPFKQKEYPHALVLECSASFTQLFSFMSALEANGSFDIVRLGVNRRPDTRLDIRMIISSKQVSHE